MVFLRQSSKAKPTHFNVGIMMGKKTITNGEVGIEVEVEGRKLPKGDGMGSNRVVGPWMYVHDGSLRGADNAEYVLKAPLMFREVDGAVDDLWKVFKKMGSTLDESNRTSVHIHLNVQGFFLNRLTSFMSIYYTFEEILTQWCGEHRVGNLFCMRAKDAPAIITQVRRFIRTDMGSQLRDHHHYAGLNTHAISKFGSLEFRALRGVTDPEGIKQWVKILKRLYDVSADFPDPRTLCNIFSGEGPLTFFETILGDMAPVVRGVVKMDDEAIRTSLYDGIRLAQDLCFSRDWAGFTGMSLKPDPFGRDPRRIATKIMAAQAAADPLGDGLQELWGENAAAPPGWAQPIFDDEGEDED